MNLNDAAKFGREMEYKMFEKQNSELSILRDEFINFPENFDIEYRRYFVGPSQAVYVITKKSNRKQVLSISKNDDLFNDVRYYLLYKSKTEPEQKPKPNNIPKQTVGSSLRDFFEKFRCF